MTQAMPNPSSVQTSNHLILGQRLQVVDVETLSREHRLHVRWHKLVVEMGCDGEFCELLALL